MMIFVIDTSGITDPRLREALHASNLDEVVDKLADLMGIARLKLGMSFYMPPSMFEELKRFLLRNNVSTRTINKLAAVLVVKAPDKIRTQIPAIVMSRYVEEIAKRLFKGLRVAEESVRRTARAVTKTDENRYEVPGDVAQVEKLVGDIIHDLREKYREATRKGVVDTVVDFDAVMLAVELRAIMVTNDEGIRRLCEDLGIIVVDPLTFLEMLKRFQEYSKKSL